METIPILSTILVAFILLSCYLGYRNYVLKQELKQDDVSKMTFESDPSIAPKQAIQEILAKFDTMSATNVRGVVNFFGGKITSAIFKEKDLQLALQHLSSITQLMYAGSDGINNTSSRSKILTGIFGKVCGETISHITRLLEEKLKSADYNTLATLTSGIAHSLNPTDPLSWPQVLRSYVTKANELFDGDESKIFFQQLSQKIGETMVLVSHKDAMHAVTQGDFPLLAAVYGREGLKSEDKDPVEEKLISLYNEFSARFVKSPGTPDDLQRLAEFQQLRLPLGEAAKKLRISA